MILESIKERLRARIWGYLSPPAPVETIDPLGIDQLSKLPVFFDPPECPLCVFEEWQCHDCLGSTLDPEAPFGSGIESATVTHMHMHAVPEARGRTIRIPARRSLCLKCFRLDWAQAHPTIPCDL